MACCKVCCGCKECAEAEEGKCCCGTGSSAVCCQPSEYCCDYACVPACEEGEGGCLCGEECCPADQFCCNGVCQTEPCDGCETDEDCPEGEYCCEGACGEEPCCTVCVYYSEDDCGYTRPTWDCSFTQSMCDDYGGTFYRVGGVVTVPAFTAKADYATCTGDEEEFGPYDVNPCDCTYEESPP